MATNRIKIVSDDTGVKCKVWDKDGKKYNVTEIFSKISGQVAANIRRSQSCLELRHGSNSLQTDLTFQPVKKDIRLDVEESVINQILQLGAEEDEEEDEE